MSLSANDPDSRLSLDQNQTLGRRRLLKALGATGGVVAGSLLLPAQWSNPVVEIGYLPVHAQTSGLILSTPDVTFIQSPCTTRGNPGQQYQLQFAYQSFSGNIGPGVVINHAAVFQNGATDSFQITLTAANISGDGFQGTITYPICLAFGPPANTFVTITLAVQIGGRTAARISFTIPRPPGALNTAGGEASIAPL